MEWYELVGVIFGPGGAVYIGLRAALNGMRNDMKETKAGVQRLVDWHTDAGTGADNFMASLKRIEAKLP